MTTDLARKLRRQATPPELAMWRILQPLRRRGLTFRRQIQIGTYYVDFVCHRPALVIEVDGGTHTTDVARANDDTRDDYLRGRGYRVLRFWNNDVMSNPDGVYQTVDLCLSGSAGHAAPLTPAPLGRFASKLRYPPREGEGDPTKAPGTDR